MLDSIRKQASGWVVRGFLVILVLSFALWGIGDVFRAGGITDVVAEVDGLPITAPAVQREAELGFEQMQQQFGGSIPQDQAIMASFRQRALQSAIARRLVEAHARDLGLTIADPLLAQRVREQEAFQTAGQFDRSRFEMFLRASGIDEASFLQQLRMDSVRENLLQAMLGPVSGTETAAKLIDSFQGEMRTGRALVVTAAAQPVEAPDDATLEAYRAENESAFQTAERRTGQLVTLRPEDLAGEIAIDEAELRAAYEDQIARFRTPEQRTATQLLAPDEATIREAAGRVGSGETFEAVAAALASRGITRAALGQVVRGSLPEGLEAAVFQTPAGGVSEPVRSDFGWHLVRVEQVTPETVEPFENVQAELAREIALRRAADQLPRAATALDDALAAGGDLAAAAQEAGGVLTPFTVDRAGQTPDGKLVPRLTSEMLDEIFGAREGETSLLETSPDGGYFVYQIEKVDPARPQTLAEARSAVEAAWRRDRQVELARAEAQRLLAEAKAGIPLAKLASEGIGRRLVELGPVRRDAEPAALTLGEAAHATLFRSPPGAVADEITEVGDGVAVIVTDEIIPADPAAAGEATARRLQIELRNDLAQSYERALRGRYTVETNQRALAALLETTQP